MNTLIDNISAIISSIGHEKAAIPEGEVLQQHLTELQELIQVNNPENVALKAKQFFTEFIKFTVNTSYQDVTQGELLQLFNIICNHLCYHHKRSLYHLVGDLTPMFREWCIVNYEEDEYIELCTWVKKQLCNMKHVHRPVNHKYIKYQQGVHVDLTLDELDAFKIQDEIASLLEMQACINFVDH